MRTLAIDPGVRRVGLALSDAGGRLATPHDVLQVHSPSQTIVEILQVIRNQGVERLVVGLAVNMDGSNGSAARAALKFGRELAAASGLPVAFVDERLSTFQAEQDLLDRKRGGEKITRKGKKKRLDALAAAVFLQAYLDGRLAAISADTR
jgi:putative Holliday junction resolvase